MTLTEIALMSRLTRLSMISCWAAGSPDGGLRKTTSTPTSPAALLQPASTIDQNGSGLLLTKATLGLPPALEAPAEPDGLGALQAGRARSRGRARRERRRVMVALGESGSGRKSGPLWGSGRRKTTNRKS